MCDRCTRLHSRYLFVRFHGGTFRLALTTLAIRGLLDQQIALRTGGLYWVTVDQPTDAKVVARQFIEALAPQIPSTLISCANTPHSILSDLAPDRGPAKLKLFEIPVREIKPGLATLTRDMSRAGIGPASQVVLVAPASSWGDKVGSQRLQRWCERVRAWLQERQATLLVIAHGDAQSLHSELLQLNETLSGLSRLYRHNGDIRYQLHFWHNRLGVSAGQEFKLSIDKQCFTLIPQSGVDTQPRVADDQHVYLVERAVLEGSPSLSRHWYLFEDRQALLQEALSARAATVIVSIDNSHQLLELAQQLHDLREKCGPELKVVVREMEPAVRYRDERLLLACGANLIVPEGTVLSRFLSMIESVQGQRWQYSQNSDFETLLERQRPPQIRGLVSPRVFYDTVEQIVADSSGEVTHQLLKFQPVPGLEPQLFLNQMCLRRFGDIACLLNGELYLFLFACRADGLDPALGNICRLPWRDLFNHRQVLNGMADLPEDAFMQAPVTDLGLYIPIEHSVTAPLTPLNHPPLIAQRITLPLSEPAP